VSQQEVLRAAVYEFGAVRAVRTDTQDPQCLSVVQFVFDHGVLNVEAVAGDDTILATAQRAANPQYYDVTAARPWASTVGGRPLWIWTLTNQQGYTDGLQLLVHADGQDVAVQLIVMAGALRISVLQEP
jgi:hypothetical protein